jgi:primase-polymerase (primpol)-like protein
MIDTYTPTRFEHHPDNVPDELKTDETWVCCDENKVPLIATLSGAVYAASSTDPATWRSHEEAYEAWLENEWSYAGVGRVIRAEEGLVGVDFDKCLNPETGELTPWATAIIERLDSYAEVSPSGTGVKVWVKAPTITRAYVKPGLEIYPRGRYFTVTGLVLGETREIARRDEELETIVAEEFPRVDRDRTAYDGPKRALDLLDYLEKANVEIFSERSDETAERVYSIRCPWFEEHTGGDESGTRVGQYPDGATFFRCEHAHCREVREWRQFKAECDPIVYLGRCRRAKGRLR